MSEAIRPIGNPDYSAVLRQSWEYYAKNMIDETGRPLALPDAGDIDRDGNTSEQVTFSEAAAYVMLRAVLVGDHATFVKVWQWTRDNLQRQNIDHIYTCPAEKPAGCANNWWQTKPSPEYQDHLFAWRYVPSLNGGDSAGGIISYKSGVGSEVVDLSGYSAASDDIEIAAALALAGARGWDPAGEYAAEAKAILGDAWEKYVVKVGDRNYFFAGDQFARSGDINPSYFRPAFFRSLFQQIDGTHPWASLTDTVYDTLEASGDLPLGGTRGTRNLPPNWLALDYNGNYTTSVLFPGVAGELFGRDAFRTLYAVAQDYAWFGDPAAERYLTDPQVGPLAFLRSRVNDQGMVIPAGFHHDGSSVSPNGVEQTTGLNQEHFAFYGGYVPFLYYAGEKTKAQSIIDRLGRAYNQSGYWGADSRDYYNQNWVWFGLMLTNGLPEAAPVLTALQTAKAEADRQINPPVVEVPAGYTLQVDLALGDLTPDRTPVLSREAAIALLDVCQIKELLAAIAEQPYSPLDRSNDRFAQFIELNRLDQQYPHKLLAYFTSPTSYWNNVITLLSAAAQKLAEANDREGTLAAVEQCRLFRQQIAPLTDLAKIYAPHDYSKVTLDLTEAELRSRLPDQGLAFYEEGRRIAAGAIDAMFAVDRETAAPDYYLIGKALLIIGDLYLQLDSERQSVCSTVPLGYYREMAGLYYDRAAEIGEDRVNIFDPDAGLFQTIEPADYLNALLVNWNKGYLSESELTEAKLAIHYLRGAALAKGAAVYLRETGAKEIDRLFTEIARTDEAFVQLALAGGDPQNFNLAFAQATRADLLLALSDRVKYLSQTTGLPLGMAEEIKLKLAILAGNGLEALQENADRLVEMAAELYRQIPDTYSYLYATAQVKQMEIAIRRGDFINREFSLLRPFYTNPALLSQPIPENEFMYIQMNYLKALLLVSTKRTAGLQEARDLLDEVLWSANNLAEPYRAYFQLHARLKLAEIIAKIGSPAEKRNLTRVFAELEKAADQLAASGPQLSWQPYSFKAELYHEWSTLIRDSNLAAAQQKGAQALEMCRLSNSPYDRTLRMQEIITAFKPYLNRYEQYVVR